MNSFQSRRRNKKLISKDYRKARPDVQILSFDDGTIHDWEYEETESYQVTEMFINNRKQILGRLLSDL